MLCHFYWWHNKTPLGHQMPYNTIIQTNKKVVVEEKVVEEKEVPQSQIEVAPFPPVKKQRKPYTRKLVIGKETEIKDVENIEEAPQPKRAKKAKSKWKEKKHHGSRGRGTREL